MLEKEFVAGIISDNVTMGDVIERCKASSCLSLKSLLVEILRLQSKLLDKVPPIVSFEPNASLKNYEPKEKFSPETRRQLMMLDDAIAIVEAAMVAERQETASQDNQETASTKHERIAEHHEPKTQEKDKPSSKGRGIRPKSTFDSRILVDNKDELKKKLHSLISGKESCGEWCGKLFGAMIYRGEIVRREIYKYAKEEFGLTCSESGFNTGRRKTDEGGFKNETEIEDVVKYF